MTLSRYLPDANAFSEMGRPRPDAVVRWWFERYPPELIYLSVIVLGEMHRGVVKLPSESRRRAGLEKFLADLESLHADRTLPVDKRVAKVWGELTVDKSRKHADTLIAATALVHGLVVVTRNVADFSRVPGLKILNPWNAN